MTCPTAPEVILARILWQRRKHRTLTDGQTSCTQNRFNRSSLGRSDHRTWHQTTFTVAADAATTTTSIYFVTVIVVVVHYSLIVWWYLMNLTFWKFAIRSCSGHIQILMSPSRAWTAPTSTLPSTVHNISTTQSTPPTNSGQARKALANIKYWCAKFWPVNIRISSLKVVSLFVFYRDLHCPVWWNFLRELFEPEEWILLQWFSLLRQPHILLLYSYGVTVAA